MKTRLIAFTDRGYELAERIAEWIGSKAERCKNGGLNKWTGEAFAEAEVIIFIGAAGIAVRAIAPYVRHKAEDPAVIVIDETGKFVIPILSGHLGGANEAAEMLAEKLGAMSVITTATDRNGVFAVDTWAKKQGCAIADPENIKNVSAKLLKGEKVYFLSEFKIEGTVPKEVEQGTAEMYDFYVGIHNADERKLICVPKIVVLGIGCKKGTAREKLEKRLKLFLEENKLAECAVCEVCSIDIKKDEEGLVSFCGAHGWPLKTFSAEQLSEAKGDFSASVFVSQTVGVDNVCERSAVLGSGGNIIARKFAGDGVTIAAAVKAFEPEWE